MKILLALLILSAVPLHAENAPALAAPLTPPPGRALWKASLATLAVTHALDIQSSWGKRELNPVLAGPSGTFGAHGAFIKLGIQGGLIGMEYLITRGHPTRKVYRAFAMMNFAAAAVTTGVAFHNYTIPR